MPVGWQDFAVLAAVALAISYLGRRGWRTLTRKGGGGCAGCPSRAGQGPPQQVVSIGTIGRKPGSGA